MNKLQTLHPSLNAYTVNFDNSLLDEIRHSYFKEITPLLKSPKIQTLMGGEVKFFQPITAYTSEYFLASLGKSPLLWLSSYSDKTYQMYKRFFDRLELEDEIKALIDCHKNIVLYCGFLVLGTWSTIPNWHYDLCENANAFTLVTPLFEFNPKHGHLIYSLRAKAKIYSYKLGEGLMFGEKFLHSTEPYPYCGNIRVLVSLSLGTDKLEYWNLIAKTAEGQSSYIILPCGHKRGTCSCLEKHGLSIHHPPLTTIEL